MAEDSDLIRKMYDLILARYRREGTEILHAANGSEALAVLGRHPDTTLVITDRNMPVMDGMEFIRRCQQNKAVATIPILVASTLDQPEGIREAIQAGAKGYLTKPFDQDQLHVLIGRLFGEAGPAGAASGRV